MRVPDITINNDINSIHLDPVRAEQVWREIRRVTGFFSFNWLLHFLLLFLNKKGRLQKISYEVKIEVKRGSRINEYYVLGKQVLHKKGQDDGSQFYMGILLIEWLR